MDKRNTPAHPWPDDHVQLSEAEARDVILFATHRDKPVFKVDGAFLGLLEKGQAVFAMGPGNVLAVQASQLAMEEDERERGGGT